MTQQQFKELARLCRRHYTKERGLLVILRARKRLYLLTAGPLSNGGLVLENVRLWADGEQLYQGQLDATLQHKLTELKICHADITDCVEASHNHATVSMCTRCPGECPHKTCMFATCEPIYGTPGWCLIDQMFFRRHKLITEEQLLKC